VETENTNLNVLYRRKLYLFNSIIIQQYTIKLVLILILAVIFWWLPLGWAQAADLKYVRAGEHGSFTRIVFEFEGMVRSTEPTIIGRGIFNVIFFDMTTALPRQILNNTTKGIQSVELIQEKSRLTANITLSFPDFKLKTFSLSNPDRFIIDAYRMSSLPKTSELADSLQAGPLDTAPDTEKSLHAKPDTEEPLHAEPDTEKPLHAEPDKVVLTEPTGTDQMIRTKKSSIDGNYNVQNAQDDRFFFIQRPKLGLGGYYKLVDEERESPNNKTKNTNEKFRESMTVATNGWMYHPDLMTFHLSFEPQWQQETFRQNQATINPTQSYDRDTSLLAYDVGTTLLQHKPLSLNIFANRKTGEIDLTNAQDSDIESETYGTRLNFNNPTLPVSIAWTHRKFDQTGFYQSNEDRDEAQVTIRHNAKKSVTQLNMLYNNSETTRTTFDTIDISSKTMNTELTNAYFITDDNRVRLDSQIYNMKADYNDLDQNTWILSENLFWTHSKDLLTRYRADYNRREFDGSVNEETRLSAGLTHHLYDRLTTDLGAAAVINKFEDGSEDLYKSNLGFLYRRPIDWGSVELGAAYDYGITNRNGTEKIIPTEDRLTLSTGTDTFLDKENVDLGSIIVTDITGAVVYTENIDYQITMVGPVVSVSRTLLGAIADGQQVNVHYSYQINAAYDDSRFGQKYRFGLALWSFLYLAYSHYRIDQHIQSGEPPNDPLHDTSDTVHLSFVTKWSDTQFLYDNQDRTNGNSSVTRSITQRINLRPAKNIFLNLSGNIGDRDFPDLDEDERFYSLGSSIGWTPKSWCNFSLNYLLSSLSGDLRDELNSEFATTVNLRYGVWIGSISYRLRDQDDKQNGNRLWRQETIFQIIRHLW
jgi:hypothetical protein